MAIRMKGSFKKFEGFRAGSGAPAVTWPLHYGDPGDGNTNTKRTNAIGGYWITGLELDGSDVFMGRGTSGDPGDFLAHYLGTGTSSGYLGAFQGTSRFSSSTKHGSSTAIGDIIYNARPNSNTMFKYNKVSKTFTNTYSIGGTPGVIGGVTSDDGLRIVLVTDGGAIRFRSPTDLSALAGSLSITGISSVSDATWNGTQLCVAGVDTTDNNYWKVFFVDITDGSIISKERMIPGQNTAYTGLGFDGTNLHIAVGKDIYVMSGMNVYAG